MYIYIYIYIYVYISKDTCFVLSRTILVYFRNRPLYQNLACGTRFQFNNHDLFENVDRN